MRLSPSAILLALLVPTPASAGFLECVADTHLARKGTFVNGTTTLTDAGVWEWEIGSGNTYSNIQGISADGLFFATGSTGNDAYGAGAFQTVNLLVGRYAGDPARPYAPEVDLLLDACAYENAALAGPAAEAASQDVSEGGSAYCTLAVQLYARVVGDFPDPADNVDRHIPGRASIAGWDVATHVRAAWRAGFKLYAWGMLDRLFERRAEWEHVLYSGYDATDLAWGALVRVMLEMRAADDLPADLEAEALDLAGFLIADQAVDGSWGDGDFQSTAYVIMGLRADPWNFSLPWQGAIIEGVDFLQSSSTASPSCGWSHPPEYGEINSEALTALAVVNTLPFVDGFETGDSSAWTDDPGAPLPLAPLSRPTRRTVPPER